METNGLLVATSALFTVVGGLLVAVSNMLIQKRQWEWKERFRYNQERRKVYAQFTAAALDCHLNQSYSAVRNLKRDLTVLYDQIRMIATKPVERRAEDLLKAVTQEPKSSSEASSKVESFVEVVRQELGVAKK